MFSRFLRTGGRTTCREIRLWMRWLADVKVKKCSAVGIRDPVVHGLETQLTGYRSTGIDTPRHRVCQSFPRSDL